MKLETERLILRKPTMDDLKDLISGINNLNVSRYLLKVKNPYNEEDAKWWVNHANEKKNENHEFNIELKSEKKLIGGIGLSGYNEYAGTAEIGYWVAESYWKQGIVSEAVSEILKYAFDTLNLRRITLKAYAPNEGSNAVANKFGFSFEGTMRQEDRTLSTGDVYDTNFYGLLKEDWKKE